MLRFLVPLVLSISIARAIQYRPSSLNSAASEAQIRFAIENRYDDTGPGARRPELAYNTYKTLEEVLIGYIDDPDTKLPEQDRERAIQKLTLPNGEYRSENENQVLQRYLPKTVEEYTAGQTSRPKVPLLVTKFNPKKYSEVPFLQETFRQQPRNPEPSRLYDRLKPLRLVQFSRDPDLQAAREQFDPHPKYSYSYGVHVPDTGDSKRAHESREGGVVTGYYSFLDSDGRLRTVHYTADDILGFRATVQRDN